MHEKSVWVGVTPNKQKNPHSPLVKHHHLTLYFSKNMSEISDSSLSSSGCNWRDFVIPFIDVLSHCLYPNMKI